MTDNIDFKFTSIYAPLTTEEKRTHQFLVKVTKFTNEKEQNS